MMKRPLKLLVPILLILAIVLSGCEIPNPRGAADIDVPQPGTEETVPPSTEEPPSETEEPAPPPEEPPPPAEEALSTDVVSAPTTPDVAPVPGKVLAKLAPQAAIQARSTEMTAQGVVAAGVPTLDQTLQQIGAVSLQPVIEPVAEGLDDSLESLSQRVPDAVNQLYTVEFDPAVSPEDAAAAMSQDANVEFAEPNFVAGITAEPVYAPAPLTPNDPYFSYQWHYAAIQLPSAWDQSTGQNVTIAVVDTGVDFGGSDMANTNRLPGYDFANQDNDPTDDQGHGTHVAGTIAQSTNNGVGVAGVAFNATVLPVKVLGSDGQGSYEHIIQGIIYAVDQGANVINLSLAGRSGSQALAEAIQYAYQNNVVVVAAAGNNNGPVEFPAAYDNLIAVGAVQFDNTRAPYSNFGPQIDVMAPGGNTKVDQNQDGYGDGILQQTFKAPGSFTYLFFEGTSMASPHVAGVAGLLKSVNPNATVDQIRSALVQTARSVGPADQFGAGLIQAADALAAIGGEPPITPTDTPTPTVTFTPVPGNLPDLVVTDIVYEPGTPPQCGPHPEDLGTRVWIANNGSADAGTFVVMLNGVEQTVPSLAAGANTSLFYGFNPPEAAAIVDVNNDVEESDETNNQLTKSLPVPTPLPPCVDTPTPTPTPTEPPPVTDTPTPTPTSMPLPPGELLTNGGFETDEGWVFGDTPIRGGYNTEVVFSGNRSARLGATGGYNIFSFSSVWQKVTIPAEANRVVLNANVYPISQDACGVDLQYIALLNNYFRMVEPLSVNLSDSQTWENRTFDVSHMRGQTVYVYFSVLNRGCSGLSAMYVDDVSLRWE